MADMDILGARKGFRGTIFLFLGGSGFLKEGVLRDSSGCSERACLGENLKIRENGMKCCTCFYYKCHYYSILGCSPPVARHHAISPSCINAWHD